jgi:hypothetical protein
MAFFEQVQIAEKLTPLTSELGGNRVLQRIGEVAGHIKSEQRAAQRGKASGKMTLASVNASFQDRQPNNDARYCVD